jgi:two-component system sensor histidine kinase PilS (NtrC family)
MADGAPLSSPPTSPLPPRQAVGATASAQRRRLQQAMLDPRRMIRWVYLGRFSVATSIFLAAQLVWSSAATSDTRIASLIFAVTMVFTVASAAYTEVYGTRRGMARLGRNFLYGQCLFDLVLVTAVVHVTGGGASQFALFYILVIASAALLLPVGGGLLVALMGIVCYFVEVLWLSGTSPDIGVWLQLVVFGIVALASGYISARLQEAGQGTAAELVFVRLQADDILRNIRSGIVTVDAQGTLLFANPAAGTLLGIPFADLIGTPVLDRIAHASPTVARALARAAVDGLRTTRAEDVIRFADHAFPIGLTTTFSDGDGATVGRTATAIFQDISGQKRLESLHVRAGRLEAIAELSASLAHEIRNPLASIRSAVEQLTGMLARAHGTAPRTIAAASNGTNGHGNGDRNGSRNGYQNGRAGLQGHGAPQEVISSTDEDDARTLGALIVRESDRLSRLLTEFLDFARVRVARLSAVDIAAVARGAANLAMAHPDVKEGLRVNCITPETPVIIDGDEDLLHRAAFNLVLNAVQAAPLGGHVQLEVSHIPSDQLPSGVTFERGAVSLRVTDNGPGIAPEVRDRLFEPFITTKGGGSGLGLPIVHRAIEAHRGVVLVDSAPERGTRFTVLLPYDQSDEAELETAPELHA